MTKIYKVKDIKISTDSVGFRTATHFGKILIDSALFENREACRKEAAKIIHQMNEEHEAREYENE
tara:strand:+ start:1020 stop:1214 length:195 start_codon:yes stop_codon:yes gene_type:complete